jgi:hypothetical protein
MPTARAPDRLEQAFLTPASWPAIVAAARRQQSWKSPDSASMTLTARLSIDDTDRPAHAQVGERQRRSSCWRRE